MFPWMSRKKKTEVHHDADGCVYEPLVTIAKKPVTLFVVALPRTLDVRWGPRCTVKASKNEQFVVGDQVLSIDGKPCSDPDVLCLLLRVRQCKCTVFEVRRQGR